MTPHSEPWLFNEFSHPGVDHADPAYPERYEKTMRRFRDFDKEAAGIVAALGIGKNDVVVDLGCGTGAFAVPGAASCRKMIAVDPAQPMLDFAAAKARSAGIANIKFVPAGFLTYRHPGEPADAAVTRLALHHLPDFWKAVALRNIHSFLKPGGKFLLADVIFSFAVERYGEELAAGVEEIRRLAGDELAAEAIIHYREEFSTCSWIMEGMLERAGFRIAKKTVLTPTRIDYVCEK